MNADPVELAAQLRDRVDGQIETDRPLAPFTSYKIGGSTAGQRLEEAEAFFDELGDLFRPQWPLVRRRLCANRLTVHKFDICSLSIQRQPRNGP